MVGERPTEGTQRRGVNKVLQLYQSRPRNARWACVRCRDVQPVADPLHNDLVASRTRRSHEARGAPRTCAFTCAATAFALAEMPRPRPRTETVECLGDFQIQPQATLSYELDRLFLLQRNRPATMHRSQMNMRRLPTISPDDPSTKQMPICLVPASLQSLRSSRVVCLFGSNCTSLMSLKCILAVCPLSQAMATASQLLSVILPPSLGRPANRCGLRS